MPKRLEIGFTFMTTDKNAWDQGQIFYFILVDQKRVYKKKLTGISGPILRSRILGWPRILELGSTLQANAT